MLRLGPILIIATAAAVFPLKSSADSYQDLRLKMVEEQLKSRDIRDPQVLEVMAKIPRHRFVPQELAPQAYADHPLPIGEGQTISQPYIVALMTQLAGVEPEDKVLEIGTGSGYQAAVLADLTKKVYTIEIRPSLAEQARQRFKTLDMKNIQIKRSDGYFGWPEEAPFDVILITAAVNHIPPPLIRQLNKGGRLILPLGSTTFFQTLTLVTKDKQGELDVQHITTVSFVPLVGEALKR